MSKQVFYMVYNSYHDEYSECFTTFHEAEKYLLEQAKYEDVAPNEFDGSYIAKIEKYIYCGELIVNHSGL